MPQTRALPVRAAPRSAWSLGSAPPVYRPQAAATQSKPAPTVPVGTRLTALPPYPPQFGAAQSKLAPTNPIRAAAGPRAPVGKTANDVALKFKSAPTVLQPRVEPPRFNGNAAA